MDWRSKMNARIDLIERAVARLRGSSAPDPECARVSPGPALSASEHRPAPVPAAQTKALLRTVALDAAYLLHNGILMPWANTTRMVEEYRIVKRRLMRDWDSREDESALGHRPRVVMITSARPREGKTFSSINLALAFAAEENLTTVLVDADTVQGQTARTLQLPPEPGFIDVLRGHRSLADALIQTDIPRLVVLPSGLPGPHVPELLSGNGPGALFAQIAEFYPNHIVILDTPPCLSSTDPTALAPHADQTVFVVKAGRTQRPEVESAVSMISGCPQVNFLLNFVPAGTSEHFGSYGNYSYFYKSG
jgi:receptor protein-tyrosine kinase